MTSISGAEVRPHSRVAKILHWGFIGVFLFALTKQLDEVEELEDFGLLQYEMIFASIFLVILVARFVFMQMTGPSAMPERTPVRQRWLARTVHLGMYAGLALIPLSGLWIGGLYGTGIKHGFWMDAALLVHEIAVNTTYTLIVLHIAAAVLHRRQGDGIWNSMVPIWKERAPLADQ